MRVISGTARGRKLITLEGDAVRPTTDKVKESVFNIIQFDLPGCFFLDLFSGSGQIGIEALSRGATNATFVDNGKASIETTRTNLENAKLSESASVIRSDSLSFLTTCRNKFDIAFLDPPYSSGLLESALNLLGEKMNESGIVICENPVDEPLDDNYGRLSKTKEYRYGKLKLTKFVLLSDN